MENFQSIKLSQSQPVTPCTRILSPSPLKKTSVSRINSNVARELFSSNEENEIDPLGRNSESPSNFMRSKIFSLKVESDTSSANEWSSDSSCSNYLDIEFDSPGKKSVCKNPFNQDQIFGDIAHDIPSRASNPIINDIHFRKNERMIILHSAQSTLFSRAEARISEFC